MSSLLKSIHHLNIFQRQARLANLKYAILAPVCLTLFRAALASSRRQRVCTSLQTHACWTPSVLFHSWTMNKDRLKSVSLPDGTRQYCFKHRLKGDWLRDTVKVKAYQTLYCMIHGVVLIVLSGHTGTAAIRVGCSMLVSPLLPFLIFVDFGWETEAISQKWLHTSELNCLMLTNAWKGLLFNCLRHSRSTG